MRDDVAGPDGSALSEGLGPGVEMPEPIGAVMPEDGTEYVDCYSAAQMHDYASVCVVAATTECTEHWQRRAQQIEAGGNVHSLAAGEVSRRTDVAVRAMDAAIVAAINAAKDAGVPQGLIVGLLHSYAHDQTAALLNGA